ncbi:MAG: hypothetical protein FWE99_00680 [Bacteroidales bacterium]|nr:hypothetical protein [Bacteroidales bacterium]
MFTFFVEGGIFGMTILTIILLALLLAAWKAPAWVKEIGIMALVGGVILTLLGFYTAAEDIRLAGDIPQRVLWAGLRVMVIPLLYGLLIYFASLIIRIIQKPRI